MVKNSTACFIFIFLFFTTSLYSQEQNEDKGKELPKKEVTEPTQEPVINEIERRDPPQPEIKPNSEREIKRVAPNQRDRSARRPQARPPRGARPEIVRPGGERRPAGAGRPRGTGRPGRN